MKVVAVIPALNEAEAIGLVLDELPADLVTEVVVVDNGSVDDTAEIALARGATVLTESRRGYGFACMKGIDYARSHGADVILFLDGDHSDYPVEAEGLLRPILEDKADFVLGSRTRGERERGALLPQARFGNWLSSALIRVLWGYSFTDLGPFRAIRTNELERLQLKEGRYGWTVEMQIRAVRHGLRILEIPVSYRTRVGKSKVSGTILGSIRAGLRILFVIARETFRVK